MYWLIVAVASYFIIAGYVYEDEKITETDKKLNENHLMKSLLWLPFE